MRTGSADMADGFGRRAERRARQTKRSCGRQPQSAAYGVMALMPVGALMWGRLIATVG